MECPICKNKIGFVFGTCVECGYNHIDYTYHTIKVNTRVLKTLLSEETFYWLIDEHEKRVRKISDNIELYSK